MWPLKCQHLFPSYGAAESKVRRKAEATNTRNWNPFSPKIRGGLPPMVVAHGGFYNWEKENEIQGKQL